MIVFALTFVPTPLMYVEPDHSFSMDVENGNITAQPGDIVEFHLSLVNKGNADSKLHLALHDIPWMWSGSVQVSGTDDPGATEQLDVDLEHGGTVNVTVKLRVSGDAEPGQSKVVRITASGHGVEQVKELKVTVERTSSSAG